MVYTLSALHKNMHLLGHPRMETKTFSQGTVFIHLGVFNFWCSYTYHPHVVYDHVFLSPEGELVSRCNEISNFVDVDLQPI